MPITRFFILAVLLTLSSALAAQAAPAHPRAFWREIAQQDFALPQGASASNLALELASHLGDPDPEWRDEFGYTITTAWIQKGILGPAEVRMLLPVWLSGLRTQGPANLIRRSFSALNLASAAALDLQKPFLKEEEFRLALQGGLALLTGETDLRGYDPKVGWIHVTAHASDLLACLARSPRLKAEDQPRMLDALATRLTTAEQVFTAGEDARLAAVLVALACRKDSNHSAILAWVRRLAALPEGFEGIHPVHGPYEVKLNTAAFLKSVYFALCRKGKENPRAKSAADALLEALSH